MQTQYSFVCHNCGKKFETSDHRGAKYCCRRCLYDSHRGTPATFWSRVDKSGGENACWPWSGYRTKDGYGLLTWQNKGARSSRVAWELTNGVIPEGFEACHNCPDGDNPSCCNPSHMFLGTQADNIRDMWGKGRGIVRAKLTWQLVREIRSAYALGKSNQKQLAHEYGVLQSTISLIITGKNWRE